jgi:multiple sugar transport system substrate-binding protein
MKTRTRILGIMLVLLLVVSSIVGCGKTTPAATPSVAPSASKTPEPTPSGPEPDTITALLPPISPNYQKGIEQLQKDFNAQYPNLTLKIEPASWEDMTQKLDVQVNAGTPPDIAFLAAGAIPKYIDTGLLVDISKIAAPEMLADFDEGPLAYMKNGDGIYGFPAYMSIHAIGGNRQYLEEAGIDWKTVQKNGWTYEEFREAIKKGVVKKGDTTRYGFVFACSGVTSKDYLGILAKQAGMPDAFTKDLKYAYTSKNYLELLKCVRALIDDGSMPKELSSIDAGKRWNMFLTGQTMITGKGLSVFENSANNNNKKIDANDGSAVKDSIKVEYIVLPVPTFFGNPEKNMASVDGYVTFRGKEEPKKEHLENVAKAAYFLASGKVAAQTNNDLFLAHISKSAKEAAKDIKIVRNEDNAKAVERLVSNAAPARHDIPTELSAKAIKIEDEVVVPKLQALLANEITPQQMYDAVKAAAIEAFGEDGVVKD